MMVIACRRLGSVCVDLTHLVVAATTARPPTGRWTASPVVNVSDGGLVLFTI